MALRHTRRTMGLPAQAAVGGPRRNRRGREEAGGKLECGARMMLVPCGGTGSEALTVIQHPPRTVNAGELEQEKPGETG